MIKRLGIFCTYDSEGIIDDYIIFLLQETKKILNHLAIVCNGEISPEGKKRLEQITADIVIRENVGFDMEAWRQGILQKNLADYDELILFNDSFFGPFYPFEEIFSEMNQRAPAADFWGITIHGKAEDFEKICPYGYIPEHIQSYFLVVRKKLLHSDEFLNYWKNAEVAKTFSEAVKKHEVCFTKYFSDMGFTYAAYCDTREYEREFEIKCNPYVFFTEKLLKEFHCPIIKKRVFYFGRGNYLSETYATAPRDCLNFIKENTNYDSSLIIKNLLRKLNISDIKTDLGLDYIFSENLPANKKVNHSEVVIVAHLYYEDLIPKCVKYLCKVPKDIKIVVTVSAAEKKSIVENLFKNEGRACEIRLVNPRGRDLSALYVGCTDLFKKFKYLGFINDKKSLREGEGAPSGEEFFNILWNNFLASENFIDNTLAAFEEDLNLGVLVPPPPYHGKYGIFFFIDKFWLSNEIYNATLKTAASLKIPTRFLDKNIAPLTIGNVFWCRTEALKKITNRIWKIEDFSAKPMLVEGTTDHALERMPTFAAQAEGFYTGWLMTEEFAKMEMENYIFFAVNNFEFATLNASTTQPVQLPFSPVLSESKLVLHFFSNSTILQILKYFVKSRTPKRFWELLKPFKHFLEKLGFKV